MQARLAAEGFAIRRVRLLSGRGETPVFRLDVENGPIVKVRVFATVAAAARVWRMLSEAGDGILSRPLRHVDQGVVSEYEEGEPLDRCLRRTGPGMETRAVRRTACLLASLHSRRRTGSGAGVLAMTPAAYGRYLRRVVRGLVRQRLLSVESGAALTGLPVPRSARYALTHADVCPENIIAGPRGLRIVDEERLAVRPIAFELARTVVRWPLTPALETRFLAAYRQAGGDDRSYRSARSFWIAVAAASSARYRLRRGLPGVRQAVARLRGLIAGAQPSRQARR